MRGMPLVCSSMRAQLIVHPGNAQQNATRFLAWLQRLLGKRHGRLAICSARLEPRHYEQLGSLRELLRTPSNGVPFREAKQASWSDALAYGGAMFSAGITVLVGVILAIMSFKGGNI